MADNFQSGICSGGWWNAARSDGIDAAAMSAAPPSLTCSVSGSGGVPFGWPAAELLNSNSSSCDKTTGPASVSSISFQHMTNLAMGSTSQIPSFSLSPSTMDWSTQAFLTSGRSENSFQPMLQQDLSSSSFLRQDPPIESEQDNSIDLSMNPFKDMNQYSLLDQYHLSLEDPPIELVRGSYGRAPSENYQPSWAEDPRTDASFSTQQSMDQSEFSSSTQYWNNSVTAGSTKSSGYYPLMATQFAPQSIEHKPSTSCNLHVKINFKGTRDSSSSTTKKGISSEPVLKKPRIETPSPLPTFKVRKEKLGDRVTALQQLVSPFGKTDTASVLHETIDYIKFLHDQVRALGAPYMKNGHHTQHQQTLEDPKDAEGQKQDLRSRGLCLVPVASTYPVASEIPADFWNPVPFGGLFSWNNGRAEPTFPVTLQENLSSSPYFRRGTTNIISDQIQTGAGGLTASGTLKETVQSFLGQQQSSSGNHGANSRMVLQGSLDNDSTQQAVYMNMSPVHYRSPVTVIAGA